MKYLSDFEKTQLINVKGELQQANNKINTYILATTFIFSSFLYPLTSLLKMNKNLLSWIFIGIFSFFMFCAFIYFIYLLFIIKPKKNIKSNKKNNAKLDFFNFWTYSSVNIEEFVKISKKEYYSQNESIVRQIYKNGILAQQRYNSINIFNFFK